MNFYSSRALANLPTCRSSTLSTISIGLHGYATILKGDEAPLGNRALTLAVLDDMHDLPEEEGLLVASCGVVPEQR